MQNVAQFIQRLGWTIKNPLYEKKTLDEDFSSWKCPKCKKPVTKEQLYKIGKKEKDVLNVLYDYRVDGPYKGLKGLEIEPK